MRDLTPTETVYVLEGGEYDGWRGEWTVVAPNERVSKATERLLDEVDGARCEMENCPVEGGAPVGWVLVEAGEGQWRSPFYYTALVDTGERVFFACEDCHCALLPKRVTA